ncbi:hypothetical protein E4U43_003496 [Claviceps pusilla]|uniref:endo-1,3(4)-beta-glucanase n=1 Tax=Claviceps pusilla TaxID=123648 RepID=A0A9P7SXN4_9HYPO|nr:hypothetical protein E4U43_003496 [Claviceps pusilla]
MHLTNHLVSLSGALLMAAKVAQAGYQLETTYDTSNFFNSFDFFTGQDPTEGFVEYVDHDTATREGLVGYNKGGIFMGVDHQTKYPAKGRKSVRVTSQKSFTRGLFIADIAHMPGSICGTWPAYWMFGPEWPGNGEIDILEGVNTQTKNHITLHTKPGCKISNHGTLSSTKFASADCGAAGTSAGCGQHTADNQNYGDGFNAIGGGVYATEWTSDHIAIWFFPRSKIPDDIKAENPNPKQWGTPVARFVGGPTCTIDEHFSKNQIVIDTTFCGSWAGDPNVWNQNPECSALAKTCQDYVSGNPADFAEAFWVFNSIKVYQKGAGNDNQPTSPYPTSTRVRKPTQTPTATTTTTMSTTTTTTTTATPTTTPIIPAQSPPQPQAGPAAAAALQPQPAADKSWNGQVWNGQPQPEAKPQPPPPPPPSPPPVTVHRQQDANNDWIGQAWNGLGWSAKRSAELLFNMFRG